jgi:hypothetical protein
LIWLPASLQFGRISGYFQYLPVSSIQPDTGIRQVKSSIWPWVPDIRKGRIIRLDTGIPYIPSNFMLATKKISRQTMLMLGRENVHLF